MHRTSVNRRETERIFVRARRRKREKVREKNIPSARRKKIREGEREREGQSREENAILYEYTTIHPSYYFLYRLILVTGAQYSCC